MGEDISVSLALLPYIIPLHIQVIYDPTMLKGDKHGGDNALLGEFERYVTVILGLAYLNPSLGIQASERESFEVDGTCLYICILYVAILHKGWPQ